MPFYNVVVEESIEATQHRTVQIEAADEDEAFKRVCEGEGETIEELLVDTGGRTGSDCDLVEVYEVDED